MLLTEAELPIIYEKLHGLIGKKAWDVRIGVGSFITCEFGAPMTPSSVGHVRGEWHLWVRCSAWRLERSGRPLVGSDDDRERLEESIIHLEGMTLEGLEIRPNSGDTVFGFQDALTLLLFSYCFGGDDEHWEIFSPEGKVLRIGPAASWSYVDSQAPRR
jgi:hypothetical protein